MSPPLSCTCGYVYDDAALHCPSCGRPRHLAGPGVYREREPGPFLEGPTSKYKCAYPCPQCMRSLAVDTDEEGTPWVVWCVKCDLEIRAKRKGARVPLTVPELFSAVPYDFHWPVNFPVIAWVKWLADDEVRRRMP